MVDVAHSTTSITGGHSAAVAGGAAGFMTGADKSLLDQIAIMLRGMLFGPGLDADTNPSSGTVTFTRNMVHTAFTPTGTAIIETDGGLWLIKNRLKLNGLTGHIRPRLASAGSNGSGSTGGSAVGTAPPGGRPLGGCFQSTTGGAGGATTGSQASAASGQTGLGGQGGSASAGGTGASGAGGALRAGGAQLVAFHDVRSLLWMVLSCTQANTLNAGQVMGGTAGGSGGGGGGDGTAGGGGGSGGIGGSGLIVCAREIEIDGSTASQVFRCIGGAGGSGANAAAGNRGGGGAAGGGGGGWAFIAYEDLILTGVGSLANAIVCGGGAGGNGGNGTGTGTGASGGDGGNGGMIAFFNLKTGTFTFQAGSAGGTGTANSGTTGGSGGTAGACAVGF
jgi:hypothetical protein